jgi:hypothetical protein
MEVVEAIRSRYERLQDQTRIETIEQCQTNLESELLALFEKQVRMSVTGLMQPDLAGSALEAHIRNLRSIRQHGYDYTLFEGLLRQSHHWDDLKANPHNYGTVLDDGGEIRQDAVQIFIDADKTRILELTPFAFHSLLSRQRRKAKIETVLSSADVWAFPAR